VEMNPMGPGRLWALGQGPRQSRTLCQPFKGLAELRPVTTMRTHLLSPPSPTCRILGGHLQTGRHCHRRVCRTPRAHITGTRTDSPLLPNTAIQSHPNNHLINLQVRASRTLDYLPHIQVALLRVRLIQGHPILDSRIQANRGPEFMGFPVMATLALRIARRRQTFQERHLASRLKADVGSQIPNTTQPMNLGIAVDTDMAHTSQNTKL
jgi:hypothetical protein